MCATRGHARFVAKRWPNVGRLEAAGEEDAPIVEAAQPLESGVGAATAEGKDQEETVRASLRQSAAVDALPV